MIVVSFDLETTGLDLDSDQPIEVGMILYSTGQKRILETASYLVQPTIPISAEITNLTGITAAAVAKFGFKSSEALDNLLDTFELAEAVLGHNVLRFDKPMLDNWCKREHHPKLDKLWIDTRTDLPGAESKSLRYMAADHGFLNLSPHSALNDCLTCLKLLTHYDTEQVIERANSPVVVLIGRQDRADNALAKKRKFAWHSDYKVWWKVVKQLDVDAEVKACPFNVSIAPPEILIEKLWYS